MNDFQDFHAFQDFQDFQFFQDFPDFICSWIFSICCRAIACWSLGLEKYQKSQGLRISTKRFDNNSLIFQWSIWKQCGLLIDILLLFTRHDTAQWVRTSPRKPKGRGSNPGCALEELGHSTFRASRAAFSTWRHSNVRVSWVFDFWCLNFKSFGEV